ncbi:hypothetical protein Tco_0965175 [Tanacetum coccineum]
MGYLVYAYYNISPTRYYKDDSCWSADLKSKTTEDIISIGSFMEALVLNQYVLVRKILVIYAVSEEVMSHCFASRFKVGESSAAATARQAGHTLAHRVDYGIIDTMDASIQASEGRAMTAVEEVNERVTDLATTQRQDA